MHIPGRLTNNIFRDTADPAAAPPPPPPPAPPAPPAPAPAPAPAPPPQHTPAPPESIESVRAEAAARRIENKDLKTENETLRMREQTARQKLADQAIRTALAAEGILDPDLMGMMDRSSVTIDDQMTVTGVKEAVDNFKTQRPAFFRPAAGTVPAAPGPTVRHVPVTPAAPIVPAPPRAVETQEVRSVRDLSSTDYEAEKRARRSRLGSASRR